MPQTEQKSKQAGAIAAIALLTQDHRDVEKMFKEFEKAKKADGRAVVTSNQPISIQAHQHSASLKSKT